MNDQNLLTLPKFQHVFIVETPTAIKLFMVGLLLIAAAAVLRKL
jgi:hypothetical protein